MPIPVIGLVLVVLCICFTVVYFIKMMKEVNFKQNRSITVIFILSMLMILVPLRPPYMVVISG